jgi:hypothetical protein
MPRALMPARAVLFVALVLAALGAVGAPVPGAGAGRYANPQLLIETDEVARMLGASRVRLVDVRSGMLGGVAYRAGTCREPSISTRASSTTGRQRGGLRSAPEAAAACSGGSASTATRPSWPHDDGVARWPRGSSSSSSTTAAAGPGLNGGLGNGGARPAARVRARRSASRLSRGRRPGRDGGGGPREPREAGRLPDRRPEPGRVHREGPGVGAGWPHPGRGERGVDVHLQCGRHVQGCRRAPGSSRRRRAARWTAWCTAGVG